MSPDLLIECAACGWLLDPGTALCWVDPDGVAAAAHVACLGSFPGLEHMEEHMSTPAEKMAKLKERMNREKVSWVPDKEGDAIAGEVVEVIEDLGDYGSFLRIHLHDPENKTEEFVVRGYGEVLAKRLAMLAPRPGDFLAIRYEGEKTSKGDRKYRSFSVDCIKADQPEATPDYAALEQQADQELAASGITAEDDDGNPF